MVSCQTKRKYSYLLLLLQTTWILSSSQKHTLLTKSLRDFFVYPTHHPDGTAHGSSAIIIKNIIKHYVMAEYKTKQIKLRGRELKININDCGLEYLRERHIRQRIKIKS